MVPKRCPPGCTTVTGIPKALKIEANSHPIGPPPTTKAFLGTRLIFGRLSESKMSGSSNGMFGG